MKAKYRQCLSRICLGCFMAFLVFLWLPAMAAEVTGKRSEAQGGQIGLLEGFRASRIIDETVKNDRGEELGEVDDLIMSRNGKIKKVILSVGGFLGVGYRLVAVPFKSLKISEKGDIVYNVTKQQLENHAEFDYRKEGLYNYYFPTYPTYTFPYNPPPPAEQEYRGGYRYPPYPPYPPYPRYGRPYGPFPERRRKDEYYYPWTWEYFPERLLISTLLNRAVLNDEGETVGDLDDLIISPRGKVERAILSVGGFLGIEAKLVAVPFRPLKVTEFGIVYNVTQQELKNRPAFSYEKK
jgi:sporulation protein YlmC with PRC-barrel domain